MNLENDEFNTIKFSTPNSVVTADIRKVQAIMDQTGATRVFFNVNTGDILVTK